MKNKNLKIKKSRRSFLKKTSTIAGGLIATPLSLEGMANVYGNKKLKLSVIGCGGRGSGAVVQALTADENVELVAMADAFKDRLEKSLNAIKQEIEGEKTCRAGQIGKLIRQTRE